LGGLALGATGALLAIWAIRQIDEYGVEVGISIALAAAAYACAQALHLSGAIAVVVAGLMVGNRAGGAMSDTSRRYLTGFWILISDVLNALLFLLLGLQMLVVPLDWRMAVIWALASALVIGARLIVVLPWGAFFRFHEGQRGASLVLTWGGLHGALSLAQALSTQPSGQSLEISLVIDNLLRRDRVSPFARLDVRPASASVSTFPHGSG
jgi:CPA1 family monovalent cation:H+ antiporter